MIASQQRTQVVHLGKLLVVGAALAVASIGGAAATAIAAPSGNTPVIIVEVGDDAVFSERTTFTVGTTYAFAPINVGAERHELIIEPQGSLTAQPLTDGGRIARSAPLASSTAGMLLWRFDAPGAYQLACHGLDHGDSGVSLPIEVTN
ncbi:MAG: hypothetical protein IT337_10220 [Thermomicrobiales bacterium]|nr:hypothetical protein [Thermomicrobiales bacterium]